jgi:carboxymethylenebutenolidase
MAINLKTPDGISIETVVIGDVTPKRPALMLLPTIFGINPPIMDIGQMWADRGYLVAIPDYFHRNVPGLLEISDEGRKAAFARWQELDPVQAIADLESVKSHLLSMSSCNGSLLVLGICAGGELAFLSSTRLGADVAVGFHPTHIDRHLDEVEFITGRVSLHFGADDSLVPMDEVNRIKEAAAGNPAIDISVYPGAQHGFSVPAGPSYQEAAAKSSDQRAQQLFAQFK